MKRKDRCGAGRERRATRDARASLKTFSRRFPREEILKNPASGTRSSSPLTEALVAWTRACARTRVVHESYTKRNALAEVKSWSAFHPFSVSAGVKSRFQNPRGAGGGAHRARCLDQSFARFGPGQCAHASPRFPSGADRPFAA